jgi:hypothetical protein
MANIQRTSGSGGARYLRASCYLLGAFVGALLMATLVLLAVDGHPLGLAAAASGPVIPFLLRGVASLLGIPHHAPVSYVSAYNVQLEQNAMTAESPMTAVIRATAKDPLSAAVYATARSMEASYGSRSEVGPARP